MYEPSCCLGPRYRGHRNIFFLCPRDSAGEEVQNVMQKNCKRKTRLSTNEENEEKLLPEKQYVCAVRERQK